MAEVTSMAEQQAEQQARLARIASLQRLAAETSAQLQWEAEADQLVVEELWQRVLQRHRRQMELDATMVKLFDERCALNLRR